MNTVALIGSGIMAKNLAIHAKKIDVRTICFSYDPKDVAVNVVGKFYEINIFDKEEILKICKEENIQGVLPTTELTVAIAAYISEAMGLNGNPLKIMRNITSKSWVRDRLKDAKIIRQPRYIHILNSNGLDDGFDLKYPVIVKPVGEGGKRGITVAYDADELKECIDVAFQEDHSKHGVIVEEFIPPGMECSVESLSYHGEHQIIQVTQNISSGAPHCVELGHSQPACVSDDMRLKIEKAICELLAKVGYKNGASHAEIKLYNNEVYLIELNSRLGGDGIAYPLTVLSTGYDYLVEVVRVSMDRPPELKEIKTHIRYSGIRFITKQTAYLKEIFENCENEPWLYEKNKVTDDMIEMTHNDMEHINYFIYASEDKISFLGEEKYTRM